MHVEVCTTASAAWAVRCHLTTLHVRTSDPAGLRATDSGLQHNDGSGRFWHLKKSLYGLKQAAREWHRALAKLLSDLGFEGCASDPALYVSKLGTCFIFLWVDDLRILCAKGRLQPQAQKILTTFEGRDLEEVSYVLGVEVIRDWSKQTITITHRAMITELLSRFNMSHYKRSPTPQVPKEKIMSLSEDPTLE